MGLDLRLRLKLAQPLDRERDQARGEPPPPGLRRDGDADLEPPLPLPVEAHLPDRIAVELADQQPPIRVGELLREAIAIYRAIGVSVAMDEFGVGRSNFDRVEALKPDVVKIDRSMFGEGRPGEERARRLLPRMVGLLQEAGVRVTVEGIETAAHARLAIEAKADHLQGHYLGAPHAGLPDEAAATARLAKLLETPAARRAAAA